MKNNIPAWAKKINLAVHYKKNNNKCPYCRLEAKKVIASTGAVHDSVCPKCGKIVRPENYYDESKDQVEPTT